MKTYQLKPIRIKAFQWDGSSTTANAEFGESYGTDWSYETGSESLANPISAEVGDWITKDLKGNTTVITDESFRFMVEDF